MPRISTALALACLLGPFCPIAIAAGTPAPDLSAVSSRIDRSCMNGTFSGVVVVRVHGRDVLRKACGQADIVNDVPISDQTRFKVYSTSKVMTALAVMKLVQDGRIPLDGSIREFVPDAPDEWAPVSIRHLLNHTSGIADLSQDLLYHYRSDHPSAMRTTLKELEAEQAVLESAPGTKFAYNNFGYELLAHAAERAAGNAFGEILADLVFEPAGMTGASVEAPNIVAGHPVPVTEDGVAIGYNGAPDKLEQAVNWAFVQLGAGAVRATVDDFIALDQALEAGKIVSRSTLAEMVGRREGDTGSAAYYGLGVVVRFVDGIRMEGHTGGNNGYLSDFERFPGDDAMLIVLSNRGFADTTWLGPAIAEALGRKP